MAETKGIVIDFYGNSVELDKSLDGINKALKLTKSELSTLNKELKLDPSNVDKLTEKFNKLKQQQSLLAEQVDMYKKKLAELGNYNDLTKEQQKEFEAISKELGKCEVELARVNQQLRSLSTANVRQLADQFENIGNKLNTVGAKIEGLGKALTPLSVATTGLIATGVKYNATLEQQTALFTNLIGSAEEADKALSKIREGAKLTTFDTNTLISANQYLISAGDSADDAYANIMNLAEAIASTGGGNSELQRMAMNLQQIKNVGKASSMDMKQFAMAGIDIWGILAENTGKSVKELQKMDITFDMITDAFEQAADSGGKYFGSLEAQSETLTGAINRLKAQFSELLGELTEMLLPVIKEIIAKFQEWIDKIKGLDAPQKNLITKIGLIVATAGPLLTILGKLIGSSGLGGVATGISKLLKSKGVITFFESVATAGGGLSGVLSTLWTSFSSLINPITLVIGVLTLAYAKNESFRKTVNDLVKNLLNSLKPAFENIKNVINTVIQIFSKIIDIVATLVGKLAGALAPILNTIISLFGSVLGVVTSLASFFANSLFFAINTVVGIITTLIDGFKKVFSTLANTTFGQGFINVMNSIANAIQNVIGWVSNVIGWFKSAIDFGNQLLGVQKATNSSQQTYKQYSGKGAVVDVNGANGSYLRSSGFGDISLTTNIHIDNNGMPIDEQEVNRWVNAMTDKLDVALGGRL